MSTRLARTGVKGLVGALLGSLALLGLGGCSGPTQQEPAESQFCTVIFETLEEVPPPPLLYVNGGTFHTFSDSGLRAAAMHYGTAIRTNNIPARVKAERQAETACKRLGDWHPGLNSP